MPALDGMRVLDLTQYEAGTACTQALAWLGAEVVKIERPNTGDPGRGLAGLYDFEDSEYFINWNSNKRSVCLALDTAEGRQLLLDLVPRFDVFIENFGPGVIEKLHLDYETIREIRPDVIYARIKGFGSFGPYSEYKCFDMVAQAAAGALSVTGDPEGPPIRPGPTTGDSGTGVQMALAVTAAYVQRLRTGEGQLVELSMQEAMTYFMRTTIALGSKWGTRPAPRRGNGVSALINIYPCRPFGANDYVYVMAMTDRMWETLCRAIERPDLLDDERFSEGRLRRENRDALSAEIEAWTRRHTKHEAMRILGAAGVPSSAVFDTLDLFNDPHLLERGFVHEVEHEGVGTVRLLGWPARLSRSSVEIEAAPLLGRHTAEVLQAELGLGPEEIAGLRAQGIVGREPAGPLAPELEPEEEDR
ncbi:MAG TPA: CoA transferase [Thermoanaerobaculia bacterium]|nr:CoA transferase [Thermoanaerobaculia bacterium]